MTPDDRKEFVEVVIGFAELKSRVLSAAAIELYWRSLQHWPIAAFRSAAQQLIRTCEFMPLPKDFEDLRKAGRPTAGEAWAAVLDYVRSGMYDRGGAGVSEFVDRCVAAIGGYRAIGMTETTKTHFLEKRFAETFDTLQDVTDKRERVPQIAYSQTMPMLPGASRAALVPLQIGRTK